MGSSMNLRLKWILRLARLSRTPQVVVLDQNPKNGACTGNEMILVYRKMMIERSTYLIKTPGNMRPQFDYCVLHGAVAAESPKT
jgi:hypothetical protein